MINPGEPYRLDPHDPNFRLPLPAQAGEQTLGFKEALNYTLIQEVEIALVNIDWFSTRSALQAQLEYGTALATIGYHGRAEEHFTKVLEQIEEGRSSLYDGQWGEEIDHVSPTEFTRSQAIWYAQSAKYIADAGFIEMADATIQRARTAFNTSLNIDGDQIPRFAHDEILFREARDANTGLMIASLLIELGEFDSAADLFNETQPSLYSYPEYLFIALRIRDHYREIGDEAYAKSLEGTMAQVGDEVEVYMQGKLQDQLEKDSNFFFLDRSEIAKIIAANKEYGLSVDVGDLLTRIRTIVDAKRADTQLIATDYCFLAKAHYEIGDSAGAFQLLQDAIALEHRNSLENPEEFKEYSPTDFSEIAAAYAYIGEFEHSDALLEGLPADLQLDALSIQLKYVENHDQSLMPAIAARLEARLVEHMEGLTAESREFINSYGMDLALAYSRVGNIDAMSKWFDKFIELQCGETVYGVEFADFEKVADAFYKQGRLSEAMMAMTLASEIGMAEFLTKLLVDVNQNKDWETNFNELCIIAEHVRRISRGLSSQDPIGRL